MDEFRNSCFRTKLSFSSATVWDYTMDNFSKHEIQDLIVFFGADGTGNAILFCINQTNSFKQSDSFVFFQDHTGLEFTSKETVKAPFKLSGWNTPSLQFQCIVPMQTWRIVFNGRMRNDESSRLVNINFLWKPFGFPVYCNRNNTFFKEEIGGFDDLWTEEPIPAMGYDQFGQISGIMVVDDKTTTISMDAMKLRRWNMATDDSVFLGFTDHGFCSVQSLGSENCAWHLKTALEHEILTSSKMISFSPKTNDNPTISIRQKKFNFNACLKSRSPAAMLSMVSVETVFADCSKGVLLCFRDASKNDMKIIPESIIEKNTVDLTINLDSEMCTHGDMVGNKARSLFLLKKAIANGLINDAVVPNGICVTTTAMKMHVDNNEDLSKGINYVINITKENDFERLSDCCKRLKYLWRSSKLNTELLEAISKRVGVGGVYAVRSSGAFEDGESTSSAGQYVTVLGCRPEDVAAAVLECWSSNYSTRALTYRKNNGQPLTCNMAVIVQNQVVGQVAGVAFTRDPNSGDLDKITIAASYGLGEVVVSGSIEPETAVISRQFIDTNGGKDNDVSTAAKQSKENDEKEAAKQKTCFSDGLLKKLADLCVQVENVFGSPQDIEWAAVENQIYLLQTRPITSAFAWSDEEIAREFDTPLTSDDVVMFYNVKEIYPKPMHPLSLSLDFFSTFPLFKLIKSEVTDVYRLKQLCHTRYNLCLNVCQMFQDLEPDSVYVKIIEYSIAGKSFLTTEIWEKILLRNISSTFKKLYKSYSTFKEILYIESRLSETQQLINNVNVDHSGHALNLWHKIQDVLDVLEKVTFCHLASTTNNIVSHTLLAILGFNFNKDSTAESLTNLAATVHTPDIITISMTNDIQTIADVIFEMPSKKEFSDLPVENCYNWLRLNCEKGYNLVEKFIKKYGHRGVQELDFGSETWSTDPNRLFSCLQALVSSNHRQFPIKSSQNHSNPAISGGYIKTMVFDYLSKKYRQSILYREQSKDMLVRITHILRMSYRKLGEKLVQEEKIPDSKLIFFLSQYELERICIENNSEVVQKALKRRKLWPALSSLQFDDMCCGPPVPIANKTDEVEFSVPVDGGWTRLTGCCVFPGRVKNRACVLDRIEDARHLRTGDVLIVKSVDIAWSPYFSIISGLVTEIGGVISHGNENNR